MNVCVSVFINQIINKNCKTRNPQAPVLKKRKDAGAAYVNRFYSCLEKTLVENVFFFFIVHHHTLALYYIIITDFFLL